MIRYRISFDLAAEAAKSAIDQRLSKMMNQAVDGVAQATTANWQEAVRRAKLWSGEKDAYAGSITYRMTGAFSAMVETDYRYAAEIETGRPPRDLKKMLNTSMKARTSKDGTRYLIIPFRHNASSLSATPINTMSGQVSAYSMAKVLTASKIVGHTRRLSGTGAWSTKTQQPATVRQRKYTWGDRLDAKDEEVPRNLKGLVRMDTSTKNQNRSTYLTFRVMSEKSRGWIIPAQPGQHIAQKVAEDMQPVAEKIFSEAVKRGLG